MPASRHAARMPVVLLLSLLVGGVASAAPLFIRLVDAARGTPLEFLETTVEQPELGYPFHVRMPQRVFVDGQPWALARYGGREEGLQAAPTGGDDQEFDDLQRELGALAPEEREVRSDRAAVVLGGTGPKALVSGELADGEHLFEPGGLRFSVQGGAVVVPAGGDGPWRRTATGGVAVACVPLDVSVVSARGGGERRVTVRSGEQTVYEEAFPAQPALALRLYLPPADTVYGVSVSGAGSATVTLGPAGVTAAGAPTPAPGWLADVHGSGVAFAPLPQAPAVPQLAAAPAAPELYLFTDRNRAVFAEGERVQFSVRAYGASAAGDQVVLALRDAVGQVLTLAPQPLRRTGGAAAGELELDTVRLAPGRYELQAAWGEVRSNPLPLQVVPILPDTNLALFGYNKWGSSSFAPDDLAAAVQNGLNLVVQGGSGAQGGVTLGGGTTVFDDWFAETRRSDPARFKEWQKPHFPPELLEVANDHDAGTEYLLAHGVRSVPSLCGLILYFNVGTWWQAHADDRNQAVQHAGQEWRRFPNFLGMVHCTGDGPTPATLGMVWAAGAGSFDIIHEERMAKLREVFEHKVGKLQVDDSAVKAEFERIGGQMRGAIGFGVGMDTAAKLEGDDAAKLEWIRWLCDLYPAAFREERRALAALMPDPVVNCSWTWGPGAGGGMWPETFYRPLDNPVIDIHGDYGIMPLTYSTGSDTLTFGQTTRPWVSLDLLPERPLANGLKLFLEGFSRNPAGIGVLNTRGEVAGGWGYQKEPAAGMAVLMDIGRRFGDLVMGLERRDEIAVLASLRQAALDKQTPGMLYGAHFIASKAGYQTVLLSEADVLADPAVLQRFRALFLVSMTAPLPPNLVTALAAFQKAGGRVIADEATKTDLPDVVRVPVQELNGANEVNFRNVYAAFAPLVTKFRDAVRPAVKPFCIASAPDVHLVRSVDGDLEYWTLFNDTLPGPDANASGHFVQFLYRGVEVDLSAACGGVLYDALRREPVKTQAGEAGLAWHADLRLLPGTVYLCAERPLAALSVSAPASVPRGCTAPFRVQALDPQQKPFTGRVPIEIVLADPAGTVRQRVFRTTNREVAFKIAGNEPVGTWHWTATDQATGLVAKGTLDVTGEPQAPAVRALGDLVYDAPAVHAALRLRELDIVLYPADLPLRATADALAAKLQAAGAKARVRVLWPALVRAYPMNWKEHTVEDAEIAQGVLDGAVLGRRVRGKNQEGTFKSDPMKYAFYGQYGAAGEHVYYRDVILLGRADVPANPLLDLVVNRTRMLPRNPSPSFPAPGFGFVAYAWAPFHYGHDAIVLYGRDDAGLTRAVDALAALAAAKDAPVAAPAPRLGGPQPRDGQAYAALGLAAAAPAPVPVLGTERVASSLLPAQFDLRVLETAVAGGRVLAKTASRTDLQAPPFVVADLAAGTAQRLDSPDPAVRALGLDPLVRGETGQLSGPTVRRAGGDRILPVGHGLGRVDAGNALRWFYDPFPQPAAYGEAKYPRRCQAFRVSDDEKWLLATFYDANAGANYGPRIRQFNPGVTVLLDAASGRELCRYPGYMAGQLALAADGGRALLIDDVQLDPDGGRSVWNPHGVPVFAAFDAAGRELCHLPAHKLERLVASRDGRLAALLYRDPRRYVSLLETGSGRETRVTAAEIDLGAAVAPDASFAVITYADGTVRKVAPDGRLLHETRLPAPGLPAVGDDGLVSVCAADGRIYFPGTERQPLAFGDAPVEPLAATVATVPPGLTPPVVPFWEAPALAKVVKPEPLPAPDGAAALADVAGEKTLVLDLPPAPGLDVVLLTFRYRLRQPDDQLRVSFQTGPAAPRLSFLFPYFAQPRAAAVPLRVQEGGALTVTFAAAGCEVGAVALRRLRLAEFANAARADVHAKSANPNSPRVMVPNVHGALGDPRVEQVAFGFPEKGTVPLPPDLEGQGAPKTDAFTLFDGNPYAATALYPVARPGAAPWNPPQAISTLRSAQVILEFARPCTVAAVGIWEHPGDRPVSDFALEYATQADVKAGEKGEIPGDWTVAATGQGNVDYFHLHAFAKPVTARVWRYTIIDTPARVQRLAEIELYQSAVDSLEGELDGAGGADALPEL